MHEYSAVVRRVLIPFFARRVGDVAGLEYVAEQAPCIIAANHTVVFDHATLVACLSGIIPGIIYFPTKQKYDRWYRLLGLSNGLGMIPVEQDRPSACLPRLCEKIQEGYTVGIFPEGHGHGGQALLRGKTGVVRLSLMSGVPVVPVGICGPEYSAHQAREWMSTLYESAGTVSLRFGSPIVFKKQSLETMSKEMLRSHTDRIMREVARLCGKEYPFES